MEESSKDKYVYLCCFGDHCKTRVAVFDNADAAIAMQLDVLNRGASDCWIDKVSVLSDANTVLKELDNE